MCTHRASGRSRSRRQHGIGAAALRISGDGAAVCAISGRLQDRIHQAAWPVSSGLVGIDLQELSRAATGSGCGASHEEENPRIAGCRQSYQCFGLLELGRLDGVKYSALQGRTAWPGPSPGGAPPPAGGVPACGSPVQFKRPNVINSSSSSGIASGLGMTNLVLSWIARARVRYSPACSHAGFHSIDRLRLISARCTSLCRGTEVDHVRAKALGELLDHLALHCRPWRLLQIQPAEADRAGLGEFRIPFEMLFACVHRHHLARAEQCRYSSALPSADRHGEPAAGPRRPGRRRRHSRASGPRRTRRAARAC